MLLFEIGDTYILHIFYETYFTQTILLKHGSLTLKHVFKQRNNHEVSCGYTSTWNFLQLPI